MTLSSTAGSAPVIAVECPVPEWGTIHALAANTDSLRWSYLDPKVQSDYGELAAGEELIFECFVGRIYFLAASGTQQWTIPQRSTEAPAGPAVARKAIPGVHRLRPSMVRLSG